MHPRCLAILLTSSALLLPFAPAHALEPAAAAQALGDALVQGTGGKASFASAAEEGGNIVIEDLAITSHDSSDTITFAEIVIESPTEGGEGVFSAPRVAMSEGAITGESTGVLANASMTNVTVLPPPAAGTSSTSPGVLFDIAEATGLEVGPSDKNYRVTVDRVSVEMSDVVGGEPQASRGAVERIVVPAEAFAESDFKPEMLGYDDIVLGVTWDGARDPAAKTMTISDFTVSMENGGTLYLTAELGNLPDPTAVQSENRAAAASELVVHSATVRYEDDSLAEKILDMQAEKQGVTREQYAQQITGALPFLLAALNNPQFQNQVSTALGAFLQNPESLTVRVAPETPINGAEIARIMSTAPQTLPDRLKASITANSAQ